MSTRHTDIDTDQEVAPQTPGSFYTEETLQREKLSPRGNFPQPPRRPPRSKRSYWFAVAAVIVALALIFSAFALVLSLQGQHPGTQVTPTPTAPQTTVTTAPGGETTPTPTQGVTPPSAPINTLAYWDSILGTAGTNGKVESVSFAHILGNSSLQALVTVRHSDANRSLDVYVFDQITSATPTQLFKLSALSKGEAKISGYNSVLTAQVDTNSALNTGKPVAQWTADLFREFAWNGSSLSQVAFPGLFPDLTRYQAEADQASVNAGHQPWKNDAVQVATALEARFFAWQRPVTAKLLSGGGPDDVSATVQVQEAAVQGSSPTIVVTLTRLEGNPHNIWVATGVADGSTLTLKNLQSRQVITSPVTLEGTGSAFEAVIGQAVVYDHLSGDIGHAQITGSNGMGAGTYTTPVSYTTSFTGIQEGLVAAYQNNGGLSAEHATGVMMKVLLSPAPQTLSVSRVDLAVSPSSIAGTTCGATMTLTYTATFHVQAGKTGGTIEFLYTWNNGRASPAGSVTVPPNGPSTATFTYTAMGQVGGAYAFPGVAQVNVTSPNVVQSNQVIPTGACTASSQPINALWMSNASTGWARTTTHQILRTTDGGTSWQDVTPPYPVSSLGQFPPTFTPLGGSLAWVAVSEKLPNGSMAGVVFRTSDGGRSWQQATLSTSQLGLSQMQFVNSRDGWVLSSPGGGAAGSEPVNLFRTTDGGQTWSLVARAPGALPQQGIKSGMGWISPTTGWITGSIAIPNAVYLYRTQDGGVSWQQQALSSSSPIQATQPPVFFSASQGLLPITLSTAQGPSFAVYATHDGGTTWSSSTPLATPSSSWDFLTMQQGWVVGANGATLTETSNGGQHWTALTPGANFGHISQLDFVSAQEGWAVSTPPAGPPVLLKTTDGGQTWVPVSPGSPAASWTVVTSPNVGTSFNQLNGVAAVSASNIWTVGYSINSGGTAQTLIEHWNGTSWQAVSSPNAGTYNYLYGVAAVSSTNIWAVGYSQNSSGRYPLIEHWNGTGWQVVSSPNAGTSSSQLSGVAALSATNIWAVGYSESGNNAYRQTLIEHWNGSNWQIVSSPNPGTVYNELGAVTALSATNLWAVGYSTNNTGIAQTLIEQWNGTRWQVVKSPNSGTYGNELNGVAAVSPTDIWTVGIYRTGRGITQTLIEQWNGTRWQLVSSPTPGIAYNSLSSVATVSATTLWAVGAYANNINGPSQTLIEQWNGTRWQVVSSPNPGTGNNVLNDAVVVSATTLWAVGTYANNGYSQTLTEEYS